MRIVPSSVEHPHGRELEAMSELLDAMPQVLVGVLADLLAGVANPETGRGGMSAEQVLRALIVKQMNGFSYEALAFHLADSSTYRSFCRIGLDSAPSGSSLQRNINALRPETLEAVNRSLLLAAAELGLEKGRKVRVDCTVTQSHIHPPSDSSLLWDCVRVVVRLMGRARQLTEVQFVDHTRRAKRRAVEIRHAKSEGERKVRYRDLIQVTRWTLGYAKEATAALERYLQAGGTEADKAEALLAELRQSIKLGERVLRQSRRRVQRGHSVPASEKVVSIFEPHTDIIIKDRRETLYGHKLCLSSGASGLLTDCVIEKGNPADSTLATKMVRRQAQLYRRAPRQVAMDGGFASKANLTAIKALGVKDVAFTKRRGIPIHQMVKSSWVYRRLRNFRAGMEGLISYLKRAFGLDRCYWRGLVAFKRYVWSSILAANLLTLARHMLC